MGGREAAAYACMCASACLYVCTRVCACTQRCPISLHARTYSHTDTHALPPHGPRMQAFFKSARVEFVPLGVIAAIVPWNWPFHNVINPISAAVMSGNAIVVKARKTAQ